MTEQHDSRYRDSLCPFCGSEMDEDRYAGNIWYCPKCNKPDSGKKKNKVKTIKKTETKEKP
jgi:ribosomal protein L37AE/L43A